MSNLADVVEGAAATIKTGMGTDVLAGRTYAFGVDSPNPPCLIVLPAPEDFLDYDVTFDGRDDFRLVLKILMGSADARTGQAALLGYLDRTGATSVRAAVYTDPTLGGTASDCKVTGARGYGDVEWAGVPYYGAELVVEVYG
ncbi:MAG: hypothetical protein ACM30G_17555 [Micromonosporaceae bacterium]